MAPKASKHACPICETWVLNVKRHLMDVHSTGEEFASKHAAVVVDRAKGSASLRCRLCDRKFKDLPLHLTRRHRTLSKSARAGLVREARQRGATPPEDPVIVAETSDDDAGSPIAESDGSTTDMASTEESMAEITTDDESSEVTQLIDRYETWLPTFDGGAMEADLATEQAGKVRRMEHYGLDTLDKYTDPAVVSRMFRELPLQKSWAPGTVYSYLCAYRNFLEYMFIAGKVTPERRDRTGAAVRRIVTAVVRQRRLHDVRRSVEDEKLLLDGDSFREFQSSKETERLEELTKGGANIPAADYCRIRNHFMLRVSVENRQRAGALANMTVEAFRDAKQVDAEDGSKIWTMLVSSHKTALTHGAATVGLSVPLYELLGQYVENIRVQAGPRHVSEQSGPMWLTKDGNRVSAKRVSRSLQKAWKRAGQSSRVTTTILRKTAVSTNFEHNPSILPQLGRHMDHSPAVQSKYYLISKKRQNAANMVGAIRDATEAAGRSSGKKPAEGLKERRICLPSPKRGTAEILRIAKELRKSSIVARSSANGPEGTA